MGNPKIGLLYTKYDFLMKALLFYFMVNIVNNLYSHNIHLSLGLGLNLVCETGDNVFY